VTSDQKPVGKFIHRDQTKISSVGGNDIATLLSSAETAGHFAARGFLLVIEITLFEGASAGLVKAGNFGGIEQGPTGLLADPFHE